jgi:hypothetical protein
MTSMIGQLNLLTATITSLQYALEASITAVRTDFGKQFSVVHRNLGRVGMQPARRRVPAAEGPAVDGNG